MAKIFHSSRAGLSLCDDGELYTTNIPNDMLAAADIVSGSISASKSWVWMTNRPTSLERAFQLARGGRFSGLGGVTNQLAAEGFSLSQIEGRSLKRQLRELCQASHTVAQAAGDVRSPTVEP